MNSPQAWNKFKEAAVGKWESLQPRERIMLIVALAIVFVGIVVTFFNALQSNIETQQAESNRYREALNYIANNRVAYQKNRDQKEQLRQRLINADAKVVSKLTSMASTLGFDVTVTPKDPHKDEETGVEEQEIEVSLKNVEYAKFLDYLIQIHKLDTPIYMRHINMTRTSSLNNPETQMTATITIISYRLKEQNAS